MSSTRNNSSRQGPQRRAAANTASVRISQQYNATRHRRQQQQPTIENQDQPQQQQPQRVSTRQQQRRSTRLAIAADTTSESINNLDYQFPESSARETIQQQGSRQPFIVTTPSTSTISIISSPAQSLTQSRKRSRDQPFSSSGSRSNGSDNSSNSTNGNDGDDDDSSTPSITPCINKRSRRSQSTNYSSSTTSSASSSSDITRHDDQPTTGYNLFAHSPVEVSHQVFANLVPSRLHQVAQVNRTLRATLQSMDIWREICRVQNIQAPAQQQQDNNNRCHAMRTRRQTASIIAAEEQQQQQQEQDPEVNYYSLAIPYLQVTCDQCLTRLDEPARFPTRVDRGESWRLCPSCLETVQEQQAQQMTDRHFSLINRLELLEKQGFKIDHEHSGIFQDYTNAVFPEEQSEDAIIEQIIRETRFRRRWEQRRPQYRGVVRSTQENMLARPDKVTSTNYIKNRGPLGNDFEKVIRKVLGEDRLGPNFTNEQYHQAMVWLARQVERYQEDIRQDFPSASQEVSNTLALCYYAQSRLGHRRFGDDIEHDDPNTMDVAPEYFWGEIQSMKRDIYKAYTKRCVIEGFCIMQDDIDYCRLIRQQGHRNPTEADIREAMNRGARHFELLLMEQDGGQFTMRARRGGLNAHLRDTLGPHYYRFITNRVCPQFRRQDGFFVPIEHTGDQERNEHYQQTLRRIRGIREPRSLFDSD
ncbi:hypothetical protein BDA99DRAFT_587375 [Phascolomyces articulosus]|uniref:F-box domain-containing protein n=1 Tax=Phascolomyces articulosus TaxID=60185 RepID=A0AAD5PC89_9FUNG|nr:hypothetical protein BDA99DRAFT_587375 [Phascolomyces articulosus]